MIRAACACGRPTSQRFNPLAPRSLLSAHRCFGISTQRALIVRSLSFFPTEQWRVQQPVKLKRQLSIFSSIRESMDSRTEKQQLKQFKDQLKIMLEGPKYSLASWEKEMGDSLSSWRMMVPGAKSQPEVQKMQAFREIIGVMSEHEKANPSSLLNDVDAQQRLGEAAGHGAEDVKLLLQRFQTLAVYQEWLLKRKVEGKRMPRNMDDMQILAKEDLEKKHKKKVRGRFRRF